MMTFVTRSALRALALSSVVLMSGCEALNFFSDDEEKLSGTRISLSDSGSANALAADAGAVRVSIPRATANADWPQLNGNAARSIGHVQTADTLALVWTADAGAGSGSSGRIVSSPVVAGGLVYTLDAGATVSAFNAQSGAEIWRSDLTPEGEDAFDGFGGGLAYDGGRLYVSNGFGNLHALSAVSGSVEWTATLGAPSRSAPAVAEGRVFAVTRNNRVIAADAGTGEVLWSEQALEQSAGVLGGAAPAAFGPVVVAPFSSGELNAYVAASGRVGWVDDLTGTRNATALSVLNDVSSDPVIVDGTVYAASQSGRFAAVDLRTGERLWTRNAGGLQAPYVAGNTVFFVSGEGRLLAFEKDTGNVIWARELGGFRDAESRERPITWAGPVLAGGRLLLTSDLGKIVAIEPLNGNPAGEVDLPGGAKNAPVVAGGTVYVLTDDATLAAYR